MRRSSPPLDDQILDRLEEALRDKLFMFTVVLGDPARARQAVLDCAPNPRDRAVYEVLIRQEPSKNGIRSGNRASIATHLKAQRLLDLHASWQAGKAKPGSDRQFASWWYKRETGNIASEGEIRLITKRLRDARQRSSAAEHQ